MSQIYLEENPPARTQFLRQRKAVASGAIVLHSSESTADQWPPDGGAEGVASFIQRRTSPGSYHEIVDSDSYVQVGRYEWQMFGEGTGGNRWALHLAFACQAHAWIELPLEWVRSAVYLGGQRAANMAAWVKTTTGVVVPAERISRAEYFDQKPGFITHAEVDPKRRSDPGVDFPWGYFWDGFNDGASKKTDETPKDVNVLLFEAITEVGQLYLAHRGAAPSSEERQAWLEDLAEKIYTKGESPGPTLAYINHALTNEGQD